MVTCGDTGRPSLACFSEYVSGTVLNTLVLIDWRKMPFFRTRFFESDEKRKMDIGASCEVGESILGRQTRPSYCSRFGLSRIIKEKFALRSWVSPLPYSYTPGATTNP